MINQKEGFKEVWHVWSGAGDPPKQFTGVLYASNLTNGDSGFTSPILGNLDNYRSYFDFKNDRTANAVAYTTGQMRRRVECDLCKNTGLFCYEGMGCVVCQNCSGKGYQWEYK